jgi:hypothetical protein
MRIRFFLPLFPLVASLGLSTASAQRIEFQRQKFDRSRFERPGQPAAPAPTAPAELAAPDAPMAAPVVPATPAPMVTEAPATASSVFSYSNAAPAGAPSYAPASAASNAPTAIFSADAQLAPRPPLDTPYPATATPEEKAVIDAPLLDQIPVKWFDDAKDHAELVDLQKKTGACLILYFKNSSVVNEKGLCSWFEKSILNDTDWRKATKNYLKLEVSIPGNKLVDALVAQYKVIKTPCVLVVKPGANMGTRLQVFNYNQALSRPEPVEVPLVLDALKAASTPAYQALF